MNKIQDQKLLEVEPELRKFKCKGCKETFYEDLGTGRFYTDSKKDNEVYFDYAELAEDYICEPCSEHDNEHASTLVRYDGVDKEFVSFSDLIASGDDGEIPEWFWKYFDKRVWKSTDPWRGYYQSTFKNGFVKLASGWVTGYPDKTVEHKKEAIKLNEFLQDLAENGESVPAPIYWLFELTSNVFSTASEIFADKKDIPVIEKWLEDNGFNIEEVKRAFN